MKEKGEMAEAGQDHIVVGDHSVLVWQGRGQTEKKKKRREEKSLGKVSKALLTANT